MMGLEDARAVLVRRDEREIPEERGPRWTTWPWVGHRAAQDYRAAAAARDTRREHARRLAAAPDGVLRALLEAGWDPREG